MSVYGYVQKLFNCQKGGSLVVDLVAQGGKPIPAVLTSQVSTAPLPIEFPINASGKSVEDGPCP